LGSLALRASHHVLLRRPKSTSCWCPNMIALRPGEGRRARRHFSTRRRCSFCLPQRSKRVGIFYPSRHNKATRRNSSDGPLHHAVLPSFSGWLGISRPPSFLPSLWHTRQSRPRQLSPGVYDRVLLQGGPIRKPRPTDLHTGIRCSDTSYSRTTLSLAVSDV
jgi:hypothetical protein